MTLDRHAGLHHLFFGMIIGKAMGTFFADLTHAGASPWISRAVTVLLAIAWCACRRKESP